MFLAPERMHDTGFGEELPASRLRSEREQSWIGAVERDAEREGEVALRRRRCVRNEVAAAAVGDQRSDRSQDPLPLEHLRRQRPREPSPVATRCSRARACRGITPGSSER